MSANLKQLTDCCKPDTTEPQNNYVTPPAVRCIPQVDMEVGEAEEMINLDLKLTVDDKIKPDICFQPDEDEK